eukprot:2346112-Rhodomonas_salina.1
MTSEYNEWYKITRKRPKPELEATLNQEWYSAPLTLCNSLFSLDVTTHDRGTQSTDSERRLRLY